MKSHRCSSSIFIVLVCQAFFASCDLEAPEYSDDSASVRVDTSFDPGSGFDGTVRCLAIQADDKILVGGSFANFNGTPRVALARLNEDGSLDTSFDPGAWSVEDIYDIELQDDGKIIVGGSMTDDGGAKGYLARLNADGSPDATFWTPKPEAEHGSEYGVNGTVYCIALQKDGKILIGGSFSTYNGAQRYSLARLNNDGSLDTSFYDDGDYFHGVSCIAVQSDGKVILAGSDFARATSDGSVDTSFDSSVGDNNSINCLTFQEDGKILIGGAISGFDGASRVGITRLNGDGSRDVSFEPGTAAFHSSEIHSMAIQRNGKIIIAGELRAHHDEDSKSIARLNGDGSLDTSFFTVKAGFEGDAYCIAVQSDGKILIGGEFRGFNHYPRNRIARLTIPE